MRARFTTDEIAAAALRIVDDSGVGALSMRSLAAALGTGPMTLYNYVADKSALEELVVAAIVAEVRLPDPTDDWQQDAYAIASAMWHGVRTHPAAIPLVLTRRMSSATGFVAADALIAALSRAGLDDSDRLAAFHALLGFATGAAQADLAGPLVAARIGEVAGTEYPHVEALSEVAAQTSAEEDFDRGLRMLLDGIATRAPAPGRGSRRPSWRHVTAASRFPRRPGWSPPAPIACWPAAPARHRSTGSSAPNRAGHPARCRAHWPAARRCSAARRRC
jgi:AcrR family transcriptional regulator